MLSIGEFWASGCVWTLFGEGPSPTAFFFLFFVLYYVIVLFEWTYNKYRLCFLSCCFYLVIS